MTLQNVQTLRLVLGAWTAVAFAYAAAWPMYFIMPVFTVMFLSMPIPWFGWKMAGQLLFRLAFSLLVGLSISEFLLDFPLICIPVYGLLLFFIYYNDTPSAPPMAILFMTLGITIVPVMGLQSPLGSHVISAGLFLNMALGLIFTWLFHGLIPNSMAKLSPAPLVKKSAAPPPIPVPVLKQERARLAFVSTLVALLAITIFFSLNLSQYALAMIQICFMAGSPGTNSSIQAMKGNALATCIGGIAIIIAFNLLVAVPAFSFLLAVTLYFSFLFGRQIFSGKPLAKAFGSGFITFLVLLGSSTGVDQVASANFHLRIAQILFAGLFSVAALILVEHLLRPGRKLRFFPLPFPLIKK